MIPTNPYITGNPVGNTHAFVGRDDVVREVRQVLRQPHNNAIVLYGQRRIGKSSVLYELKAKLSHDGYHVVFFDLLDKSDWPLERVLQELVKKISDVLEQEIPDLGANPETTFHEHLIDLLNKLPSEQSLVLLFDEFDVLDDYENQNEQAASLVFFHYLRQLLDIDRQRLNFVFVIGRKIADMTIIAKSLFRTAPAKRVSLLEHEDTVQLIRLSETNKTLNWTNQVIEKIWQLTSGHPYLTQHFCSQVWENVYDKNPNELPTVTLKEVNAVEQGNILESCENALDWLWGGLPPAEKVVASALAGAGAKAITEIELKQLLNESGVRIWVRELQNAPRILQEWDLIESTDSGYRFRVELLRRWIAEYKPLSKVQEELDHIEPVADSLYQAAQKLYTNHKFDEALTSLQQAVTLNPNHLGANLLLADILLVKGEPKKAHQILERLHTFQDNNVIREKLEQTRLAVENANKKLTKTKQKMRNPFIHGSSIMPDQMIGRKKELRQITGRILNGQSTIITGSSRSGKTSLLRSLSASEYATDYFDDEADKFIFSYWDACTSDPKLTQAQFWERVLKPLQERIKDQEEQDSSLFKDYQACQENKFESGELENLFLQIKKLNWKLVLIIDEFDSLLHHRILNSAEFFGGLRVLADAAQGTLVLVLTANISRKRFHKEACSFTTGSPYFNFADEIVLGALPETDIDELLHQGSNYFTKSDYLFIKEIAGGHPYLLQVAASLLWDVYENGNIKNAKKRQQYLENEFYNKVEEILGNIWHSWSPDMQRAFYSVVQSQKEESENLFPQKRYKSEQWRELERYGFLTSSCKNQLGEFINRFKSNYCKWQVYPRIFLLFDKPIQSPEYSSPGVEIEPPKDVLIKPKKPKGAFGIITAILGFIAVFAGFTFKYGEKLAFALGYESLGETLRWLCNLLWLC
jgi:tetratricopeptide (TPR) repeat protein